MSELYLTSTLLGRTNDFVETEMWKAVGPVIRDFASMLRNLENTVNEQIFARQGQFPEEMIEMLWITRLLENKYGGTHNFSDSKRQIFSGRNKGPQGKQLLAFLEQVANLDYETSAYNVEFDPELMRALNDYISQSRPSSNLREIESIEQSTWFDEQNTRLERRTQDRIWSNIGKVSQDGFVRLSEEQKLEAAIKLGLTTMQKVYGLVGEAYRDLFAIWDYEGTWVRAEIESLLSVNLTLDDVPVWHNNLVIPNQGTEFEQYVKTLRGFLIRHQNYVQNSGKVFNPKYNGVVWTLPQSLNMMYHLSEKPSDYKELEGMNPARQITERAKLYLFKNV